MTKHDLLVIVIAVAVANLLRLPWSRWAGRLGDYLSRRKPFNG